MVRWRARQPAGLAKLPLQTNMYYSINLYLDPSSALTQITSLVTGSRDRACRLGPRGRVRRVHVFHTFLIRTLMPWTIDVKTEKKKH